MLTLGARHETFSAGRKEKYMVQSLNSLNLKLQNCTPLTPDGGVADLQQLCCGCAQQPL